MGLRTYRIKLGCKRCGEYLKVIESEPLCNYSGFLFVPPLECVCGAKYNNAEECIHLSTEKLPEVIIEEVEPYLHNLVVIYNQIFNMDGKLLRESMETVQGFCCEGMENNWCDTITYSIEKREVSMINPCYGDVIETPIDYCPFCGHEILFQTRKKLREVRETEARTETRTTYHYEEIE